MKRDKDGAHLHYSVRKALGNETRRMVHTHTPKPVYEQEDVTVLWNQAVHADKEVTVNRPAIIIKNEQEKTRILVDV